jgi:hypothetical protein
MSAATTRAPSRTKTFTDAFAIPEPAPVMTATLPSNSPIEDSSRKGRYWRHDYDTNMVTPQAPVGGKIGWW